MPASANEGTRTLAVKSTDDGFREAAIAILTKDGNRPPEAKATETEPLRIAKFPC